VVLTGVRVAAAREVVLDGAPVGFWGGEAADEMRRLSVITLVSSMAASSSSGGSDERMEAAGGEIRRRNSRGSVRPR
jgi:hypothetical protein